MGTGVLPLLVCSYEELHGASHLNWLPSSSLLVCASQSPFGGYLCLQIHGHLPAWAVTLPHDLQLELAKWHPKELQTDHKYTCVHTSPAVLAYVANMPEVGRKATSLRTGDETTAFDEPSHWLLLFSSVLSMDGLPKAPYITL